MPHFTSSTENLAFDPPNKSGKMESFVWKAVSLLALVFAFVALILAIVAQEKAGNMLAAPSSPSSQVSPTATPNGNTPAVPKSCKQVNGSTGLYLIQPDPSALSFVAYCDMKAAGGGWTLVAAVHENNIAGKCTIGDKWSSEQGSSQSSLYVGERNWENKNVFGRVDAITNQDYKNQAYYSLNASNIMIWHVPNDQKLSEINTTATLQYYTTANFLPKYGGTLQSLYANYMPLTNAVAGLDPLLKIINGSVNTDDFFTQAIPNFYKYKYDDTRNRNRISDGGRDMYDSGNRVYFSTQNINFTQMTYGLTYFWYGSGVEVLSAPIYPFIALAWIGDLGSGSNLQTFSFRVISNFGADGRGAYATYGKTTIRSGGLTAQYMAFNVFNASDPSVCEVYFYITNAAWNSKSPASFDQVSWGNTTRDATNIVSFTGSPKNVLVGYTLLSRENGRQVTVSQVEAVINRYMTLAAGFQFKVNNPQLYTPITYLKGNNSAVLAGIPTSQSSSVVPGFIQFRPHNSIGLPNALCPGVRMNSNNPEQICVGGTNTASRDLAVCGDFAGWDGAPGQAGSQNAPSASGRSINDIQSSILIFTR